MTDLQTDLQREETMIIAISPPTQPLTGRASHAPMQNAFKFPTKKVKFPPVMKQILKNNTFTDILCQMEDKMVQDIDDIDRVSYDPVNRTWTIQGPDNTKLEQHRDLFNIVIWRVPVIPIFGSFSNQVELYTELFDDDEQMDEQIEWVWSVLSTTSFTAIFGNKILRDIDEIRDREHKYLCHHEDFPSSSPEYKSLVRLLRKIEDMGKYTAEVVVCGPQKCVQTLIRKIRQKEANHQSLGKPGLSWQVSDDMASQIDESMVTSYLCIITKQLSGRITQHRVEHLLSAFEGWTFVELLEEDPGSSDENSRSSSPETPDVSPSTP